MVIRNGQERFVFSSIYFSKSIYISTKIVLKFVANLREKTKQPGYVRVRGRLTRKNTCTTDDNKTNDNKTVAIETNNLSAILISSGDELDSSCEYVTEGPASNADRQIARLNQKIEKLKRENMKLKSQNRAANDDQIAEQSSKPKDAVDVDSTDATTENQCQSNQNEPTQSESDPMDVSFSDSFIQRTAEAMVNDPDQLDTFIKLF